MKPASILAVSLALATPAAAQPPSSGVDWSRPVTGVDGPVPIRKAVEDHALPVEVYTLEEIKTRPAPDTSRFVQRLSPGTESNILPPPPPPCEPPVENTPGANPPQPEPCPEPPPR